MRLSSLAKLYQYQLLETESYKIIQKTDINGVKNQETNMEDAEEDNELFVSSIPNQTSVDALFPLFLKYGNFTTLKIPLRKLIQKQIYTGLFLTYKNQITAEKTTEFLDKFEISNGIKMHCETCLKNKIIYIENLKLLKFPFYKIQQFFVTYLHGIKSINFASPNNYGRYAIRLEFFDYYAANLSKKIIEENKMFSKSTEVIIDWCQRIGPRTEPAIKFEWKNNKSNEDDEVPEIVILSEKAVKRFQSS